MRNPNSDQEIDSPAGTAGNDEGLYLDDLARGTVVEIETQHHHYKLVKRGDTLVRISGHPKFCPKPIEVEIEGSFSGKHFKNPHPGFIGRGMYLVFKHPLYQHRISTSRIREIHKLGTLSMKTNPGLPV